MNAISSLRRVLLGLAIAISGSVMAAQPAQPQVGQVEDVGVRVAWRYEALPEAEGAGIGRLHLSIQDRNTGSPVRYQNGQIAAWLQRQRGTLSDNELKCSDKVKLFATQGIGRRADIDLNTYRIVTLNSDNSIAFINPFVDLNNAKLESIVVLPGKPRAWLHVPERLELWVRVSGPDRLLAIDTHSRKITRSIALPLQASGESDGADLAYEAGASRLWLALPGMQSIGYLDLAATSPAELRTVAAPGVMAVHVVTAKDGGLIVTTHRDGRVQRWHGAAKAGPAWQLAQPARQLAYSALAERMVAHDGKRLLLLEPNGGSGRQVPLEHAIERMALFDDGRYALVAGGARMSVVDLANGALKVQSAAVADAHAIAFTSRFAYAVGGARASLWSLADLRAGRAQPVEVLLGTRSETRADNAAGASFMRAAVSPAGTGLLAANAADALIYQYAEGMMAPVGSYSNYKRTALALTVLDLAPREVAPGQYLATVRHEKGGRHELVVSGVSPRFAACGQLALAQPATGKAVDTETVRAQLAKVDRIEGTRYRVEVALKSRQADKAEQALAQVRDASLLVFDKRSAWQRRLPLQETAPGSGHYVAEVAVPRAATYELFVGSTAQNLSYLQGRVASMELGAP